MTENDIPKRDVVMRGPPVVGMNEVLHHKTCGHPVRNQRIAKFYSCPKCNAWVSEAQTEWRKELVA